jgi:hypothetical protein
MAVDIDAALRNERTETVSSYFESTHPFNTHLGSSAPLNFEIYSAGADSYSIYFDELTDRGAEALLICSLENTAECYNYTGILYIRPIFRDTI